MPHSGQPSDSPGEFCVTVAEGDQNSTRHIVQACEVRILQVVGQCPSRAGSFPPDLADNRRVVLSRFMLPLVVGQIGRPSVYRVADRYCFSNTLPSVGGIGPKLFDFGNRGSVIFGSSKCPVLQVLCVSV